MMNIITNSDPIQLRILAAKKLSELLQKESGLPVLLMLSGSSSLKMLEVLEASALNSSVTMTLLDERYTFDPAVSTMAQLRSLKFFEDAGVKVIDPSARPGESLLQNGERFEKELKEWRGQNPNGRVIITQGMGGDGHTAGIMPYPEDPKLFTKLFNDATQWVTAYDAGIQKNQYPQRITVSASFLRDVVDTSIVYIEGKEKEAAWKRLLSDTGTLSETPARIMNEMKEVFVYTMLST